MPTNFFSLSAGIRYLLISHTSIIINNMRIFVGIQLAEAVRDSIAAQLAPFKAIANSIRWTESRNIHLTLKFIGEASAAKTESIADGAADRKDPRRAVHADGPRFRQIPRRG